MDETLSVSNGGLVTRGELDAALKELDETAAKLDLEHQLYTSILPEFLYHVTTKDNAKFILDSGIKPSDVLDPNNKPAVSLTDSIDYGKMVAMETQKIEDPNELAVFQVPTRYLNRDETRSYLDVANPIVENKKLHEVFYEDPNGISPGILIPFE